MPGARREHDQAVEAERDAGAIGQAVRQGGEEILVDRVGLAIERLFLRLVGEEAAALLAAGGFSSMAVEEGWEDYDLWCRFAELGFEGVFLPELLCEYRVHGTSMLRSRTNNHYMALDMEMRLRHPKLFQATIRQGRTGLTALAAVNSRIRLAAAQRPISRPPPAPTAPLRCAGRPTRA